MSDPVAKEKNADTAKRVTEIARLLHGADAFKFGDSPLLQDWYDFDDAIDSPDGVSLEDPSVVVLHALWESEGCTYEELVTVGHLMQSRIEGGELIYPCESGEESVRIFRMQQVDLAAALDKQEQAGDAAADSSIPRMRG